MFAHRKYLNCPFAAFKIIQNVCYLTASRVLEPFRVFQSHVKCSVPTCTSYFVTFEKSILSLLYFALHVDYLPMASEHIIG